MTKEVVIFKKPNENNEIPIRFENETLWLTLNQIADLFERDKSVISRHIRNIFTESELGKTATVANFATVKMKRVLLY